MKWHTTQSAFSKYLLTTNYIPETAAKFDTIDLSFTYFSYQIYV